MFLTRAKRFILGEPLASFMANDERIPKWKALAVLSSDALSSVAYATEEILIPLAVFSAAAVVWSIPVAIGICTLLIIVSASYRQTIGVYSNGGGAYVVAKDNLGDLAGLTAGAALLIGYVLTVSVSVAAGVGAITSAFPETIPYKVLICGVLIVLITLLNLRGIRESATVFAFPTYVFLVAFFIMIAVGLYKGLTGDVPTASAAASSGKLMPDTWPYIPMFLVLRAFSSGCAALTGIEAISNGVGAFKMPQAKNAKITLTWMAGLLCFLFLGITFVSHLYGIVPNLESAGGHGGGSETAISMMARGIFGTSWFYYLIQFSTALILVLAANTSYNGFPWLASIMANDRYLPRQLASKGDRLVFSNAIIGLSFVAFILIAIFGGDTHQLIPLYAVGVFLGFTLSQAGMVRYHLRNRKAGWVRSLAINLTGAITTGVVLFVVGITKFAEGAWLVILVIPVFVFVLKRIHSHYLGVGRELTLVGTEPPEHLKPMKHTVIVPISGIHRGVVNALRYAISISDDVRAVYVEINEEATIRMRDTWREWGHDIPFVVLKSPYRSVVRPLLEYIDDLEQTTHDDLITVIVPEFVTARWWHQILHNQTALLIRAALAFKRNKVVTSVRYHLRDT